tara:strand:- start:378 stop:575 length:198 start_codon:yes stop_codon:yes gene_type:complete
MLDIWFQTRRGFGADLQVVNYLPVNMPIKINAEEEDDIIEAYGVFILSGYVIRLPFFQVYIGELT